VPKPWARLAKRAAFARGPVPTQRVPSPEGAKVNSTIPGQGMAGRQRVKLTSLKAGRRVRRVDSSQPNGSDASSGTSSHQEPNNPGTSAVTRPPTWQAPASTPRCRATENFTTGRYRRRHTIVRPGPRSSLLNPARDYLGRREQPLQPPKVGVTAQARRQSGQPAIGGGPRSEKSHRR